MPFIHKETTFPERQVKKSKQKGFFEIAPSWRKEWWGMPEFSMGDAQPQYSITINFMTADAIKEFAATTGIPVSISSNSGWFPPQKRLEGATWVYNGKKTDSRYPICIPSKGRWDNQSTGKVLDEMGVSYKFFVEETEAEKYIATLGEDKVVELPFHDLGKGSIPARNFIWEWALEREYKRHWTVDDNIRRLARCNNNRRLQVRGGAFWNAMEDFVDRYSNIAMAGPHEQGFVPDRISTTAPYLLNSRIYSCILLDTTLSQRWRGRVNEDTDLSLRLLKEGYCTLLFRALLMDKPPTSDGSVKKTGGMKGGNTDTVYSEGDHRLAFAKSLEEQHPDCVKVVWKFGRWHHLVDYSRFKRNQLKLKPKVVPVPVDNEYGMKLTKVK